MALHQLNDLRNLLRHVHGDMSTSELEQFVERVDEIRGVKKDDCPQIKRARSLNV